MSSGRRRTRPPRLHTPAPSSACLTSAGVLMHSYLSTISAFSRSAGVPGFLRAVLTRPLKASSLASTAAWAAALGSSALMTSSTWWAAFSAAALASSRASTFMSATCRVGQSLVISAAEARGWWVRACGGERESERGRERERENGEGASHERKKNSCEKVVKKEKTFHASRGPTPSLPCPAPPPSMWRKRFPKSRWGCGVRAGAGLWRPGSFSVTGAEEGVTCEKEPLRLKDTCGLAWRLRRPTRHRQRRHQ